MPPLHRTQSRKSKHFIQSPMPKGPPAANTHGANTGAGRGRSGRGSSRGAVDGQATALRIQWETGGVERTSKMVGWLVDHPADCIVLFSEDKGAARLQNRAHGTKQEIYNVIARVVFEDDVKYGAHYPGAPHKFRDAVCHCLEQ